ncbi:MAG: arsenate reductase ArsC [Ignavibacteria bacterium]|nr:arsenate reductase ArsC [Ignavibacteria bacterium]
MSKKILVLCTGNSCSFQMAEGYLKSLNKNLEVYSAGTKPAEKVNPLAVKVMKEIGIDISHHYPKDVEQFVSQSFDYVITVCDNAKETCPVFHGKVGEIIHKGFEDPAEAKGEESEVIGIYRRVRDEIISELRNFVESRF